MGAGAREAIIPGLAAITARAYSLQMLSDLYIRAEAITAKAKEMLETLMKDLLKANPPPPQGTMEWVQHMNGLKHQAEEVIFQELIYK